MYKNRVANGRNIYGLLAHLWELNACVFSQKGISDECQECHLFSFEHPGEGALAWIYLLCQGGDLHTALMSLSLSLFSSKCFQCFHIHCGATIYKLKCSQCTAPSTVPLVKAYFFMWTSIIKCFLLLLLVTFWIPPCWFRRSILCWEHYFFPPFFLTANRKP